MYANLPICFKTVLSKQMSIFFSERPFWESALLSQ